MDARENCREIEGVKVIGGGNFRSDPRGSGNV